MEIDIYWALACIDEEEEIFYEDDCKRITLTSLVDEETESFTDTSKSKSV